MILWAAYPAGFRRKAAFRYGRETKRCHRIRLANLNRPLRLEKANFNFRQKTRGSLLAHLRKRCDSLGLHDFKMDVQLVRFSKEESDSKDKLSWRVVACRKLNVFRSNRDYSASSRYYVNLIR